MIDLENPLNLGYLKRLIGDDGITLIRAMPDEDKTDEEICDILNPLKKIRKDAEEKVKDLKNRIKDLSSENSEFIKKLRNDLESAQTEKDKAVEKSGSYRKSVEDEELKAKGLEEQIISLGGTVPEDMPSETETEDPAGNPENVSASKGTLSSDGSGDISDISLLSDDASAAPENKEIRKLLNDLEKSRKKIRNYRLKAADKDREASEAADLIISLTETITDAENPDGLRKRLSEMLSETLSKKGDSADDDESVRDLRNSIEDLSSENSEFIRKLRDDLEAARKEQEKAAEKSESYRKSGSDEELKAKGIEEQIVALGGTVPPSEQETENPSGNPENISGNETTENETKIPDSAELRKLLSDLERSRKKIRTYCLKADDKDREASEAAARIVSLDEQIADAENPEGLVKRLSEELIGAIEAYNKADKNAEGEYDISLNTVRKILFILGENKFTICKRERDTNSGWLTFRWRLNMTGIEHQLEREKKKLYRNLLKRQEYESGNLFYVCPQHCVRLVFNEATENEFICPVCGDNLVYEDNEEFKALLDKRIEEFRQCL